MSKRTQLIIALSGLIIAASLLAVLFLAILSGRSYSTTNLPPAPSQLVVEPPPTADQSGDPWAFRDIDALRRVWRRRSAVGETEDGTRRTLRQIVETEQLQQTFPNLFWDRTQRVGWRSFQLEDSVYEVQFNYTDLGVEFGPAWIVQLDPDGMQPPETGGVVAANVFAQVLQHGATEDMVRYFNREAEVVEALTNHRFVHGARLGSALLVYFDNRERLADEVQLVGWTVVPERIIPGQANFYRAFFQWVEDERPYFAQWEINLDTHQFRGLNLLASEIMAVGDSIDTVLLQDIKPQNLPEAERRNPRHARLIRAIRRVVENERLVEGLQALLWHASQTGTPIEYADPPTRWNAVAVPETNRVFDVTYPYHENGEPREVTWRVDLGSGTMQPRCEMALVIHTALNYTHPISLAEILGHPQPVQTGSEEEPTADTPASEDGQVAPPQEEGQPIEEIEEPSSNRSEDAILTGPSAEGPEATSTGTADPND